MINIRKNTLNLRLFLKVCAIVFIFSTIIVIPAHAETLKENYGLKMIDSNDWSTTLVSDKKSNNSPYVSISFDKIWKCYDGEQGEVASNYKRIYVKMHYGAKRGKIATASLCKKASGNKIRYNSSTGVITLYKGQTAYLELVEAYKNEGAKIVISAMGHNKSLDCFATGNYNLDVETVK